MLLRDEYESGGTKVGWGVLQREGRGTVLQWRSLSVDGVKRRTMSGKNPAHYDSR